MREETPHEGPELRTGAGLIHALVRRPVTVVMGALAALVFGLVAYASLPIELMPDLSYPTLTVRTDYPGAAPEEVETQVARPLEEALSTIPGLARLESRSRAGQCDVVLELEWGQSMGDASQAVRERIGLVPLPDAAERPLVLRYDPNLDPIVRIALTGAGEGEAALMRLRRIADEEVKPVLETLPGVAAVRVRGGLEREVRVELDEGLLHARGLTTQSVVQRLQDENVNLAGGSLLEGQTEYLIRTLAEIARPEDLGEILLPTPAGGAVRLAEVAQVRTVARDRDVVGRIDGQEAVEIALYREADANVVSVSARVRDAIFGSEVQRRWLEDKAAREKEVAEEKAKAEPDKGQKAGPGKGPRAKGGKGGKGGRGGRGGGGGGGSLIDAEERQMTAFLAHKLPEGHRFVVISDQATWIEDAIRSVRDDALQGALLSIVVLLLFLRHIWSTVVIATAIPLSIAATFAPLYLGGRSLNLMSLGGLALASGMLVDAAIVVLESIARCRDEGDAPEAASIRGTSEVFAAVVSATLTTVAVFLPIAFVEGVAGQLFSDLSMTVVYGLLASMVAAFVLVPVLVALPTGGSPDAEVGVAARFAPLGPRHAAREAAGDLRAARSWARGWRLPVLPVLAALVLIRLLLVLLLTLPIWLGLWTFAALIRGLRPVLRLVSRGLSFGSGPFVRAFDSLYAAFERRYEWLLRRALARPATVLAAATLLACGAIALAPRVGAELLPEVHQGLFVAEVRLPVGTPLEHTLEVVRELEARIATIDGVAQVHASAGADRDDASSGDRGEHTASLTVRVGDREGNAVADPEALEDEVREKVREVLAAVPSVRGEVAAPSLFSFTTPLEVEVGGHDLKTLRAAADEVATTLGAMPGLADVQSHLRAGHPEIHIRYDRARLSQYGLDLSTVAGTVRDKIEGRVATDLPGTARRTDVRVILRPEDRASLADLAGLDVATPGKPPIPLSAVATLDTAEGPSEIRRRDQQRVALVTASIVGFDLAGAGARVKESLDTLEPREGIDLRVAGQSDEMERSTRSLWYAMLLATFLVYIIMASEFESFVQPLLILFTIPLSAVGILPALLLTATPVSVLVLIGVIVLAGVVVDNAIVLVDYANTLRSRGLGTVEALVLCGRVRMRPILMTTATTILGLLPMLAGSGQGAEMRRPLAITLVSGLASSTALTLVVIPVLFSLFDRQPQDGQNP